MGESEMNVGKQYCWVKNEPQVIEEIIKTGDAFFFQFRGNDYFIERDGNGYLIQDPKIGANGQPTTGYTNYPGHMEAKSPEQLMALPFLDGKTIFERFYELRFFD
jgi:hypothetical protein